MIKADRVLMMRTGGLALDLVNRTATTVEDGEGEHPWWRAPHRLPRSVEGEEGLAQAGQGGAGQGGAAQSGAAQGGAETAGTAQ